MDLTFDGGQTRTNLNNVYSYLKDFEPLDLYLDACLESFRSLQVYLGASFGRPLQLLWQTSFCRLERRGCP